MSWIATGIAWLKCAVRGAHLDPNWQPPESAAEVDSERQRYSAARYVDHMRSAMDGDFTGRREWEKAIWRMSPEDRRAFFEEVDAIIFAGGLVEVLTAEQMEEVRQRVLARKGEINADNQRLMSDHDVPVEYMHDALGVTYFGEDEEALEVEPPPNPHVDDGLDEDGLPAWPDLGSEEWDEGDNVIDLVPVIEADAAIRAAEKRLNAALGREEWDEEE